MKFLNKGFFSWMSYSATPFEVMQYLIQLSFVRAAGSELKARPVASIKGIPISDIFLMAFPASSESCPDEFNNVLSISENMHL